MPTYNFIDLSGKTFGRLTVECRDLTKKHKTFWNCLCDCGNKTIVRGDHLKELRATSCGCFSKEIRTTHGMSRTPEHDAWIALKDRCHNPNNKFFKNYGGRGITVDPIWNVSFQAFFDHVGKRPTKSHTIDRIDNTRGYEPGNVKWSTRKEQANNRRNSILITINGETLCLKDWCRKRNVPYSTVRQRVASGKSYEEALGIS